MLYKLNNINSSTREIGSKARNLSDLIKHNFPILDGFVLTQDVLEKIFLSEENKRKVFNIYENIKLNSGFGILEQLENLKKIILESEPNESFIYDLKKVFKELQNQSNCQAIIIRSSGKQEDTKSSSHAGIYQSISNVKTFKDFLEGIKRCWCSSFDPKVAVYRQSKGLPIGDINFAILVQPMLQSKYSGVICTFDPLKGHSNNYYLSIDSQKNSVVEGNGYLYDGILDPNRICEIPGVPSKIIDNLLNICKRLIKHFGSSDLDIEWGYFDQKIYIFQVRSINILSNLEFDNIQPILEIISIDDTEKVKSIPLGDIKFLYNAWLKKRIKIRALAKSTNLVSIAGCKLIYFNKKGLQNFSQVNLSGMIAFQTEYVILQVNKMLKGVVIPVKELHSYLISLLGEDETKTVMIREFFVGTSQTNSALSSVSRNNEVLIEYSVGGIAGIKSGLSSTSSLRFNDNNIINESINKMNKATLFNKNVKDHCLTIGNFVTRPQKVICEKVSQFTIEANKHFKNPTIEWWIKEDEVVMIDWSSQEEQDLTTIGRSLSKGNISGWALVLDDIDEDIIYLSNGFAVSVESQEDDLATSDVVININKLISNLPPGPVILICSNPLTSLSIFLNSRVKGFVFEDGPLLCHLGIILRENKIPAIFTEDATKIIKTGQWITINDTELSIN